MLRKARWTAASVLMCVGALWVGGSARAQQPPPPPPVAPPGASTNEQLLLELQQLRSQVNQLQGELATMKNQAASPPTPGGAMPGGGGGGGGGTADGSTGSPAGATGAGGGGAGPEALEQEPSKTGGFEGDNTPLQWHYKYNFGGGYFNVGDPDGEFVLNLQNQITADGTFYDRQNIPTSERGFNVPFQRIYLYGNITRNWEYQLATQGFLGSFNLLDMFVNVHYDDRMMLKVGRMLTPFLYEYYGWSPAWEPVITNSPLFQVAGKRQVGAMLWGKLFGNKLQYQTGIYNGVSGAFFDLDRNKDFIGAMTVTPFKGDATSILDSLGFGFGIQTGYQNYMLNAGNSNNFVNGAGEPTTNFNYITSTGIPFFQYNNDVRAWGNRTRMAPHFFWFGRFSVTAEYLIQSRQLANTVTTGTSTLRGYYVNVSYFLTGERYNGDGTGGYTTISPINPFSPAQGQWGPGAWELAAQFSELNVGNGDFARGFADPTLSTNRLDQLMVGMNWWPNKWVRISFDWMYDKFNHQIPLGGGLPIDRYNIFWTRVAMFF